MAIELEYAHVVQRLGVTIGDTSDDPDAEPDFVPVTSGQVVFTPTLSNVRATVDGEQVSIYNAPIIADVGADGRLHVNGQPGVWLVDLGSDTVTPKVARDKGAYQVTYQNLKYGTQGIKQQAFAFNPVAGTESDLATVQPLPLGSGVDLSALQQIATDALAARAAAEAAAMSVARGEPGGVAPLDDASLVPAAYMPDLSDAYVGLVNGSTSTELQAALDALPAYTVGNPLRKLVCSPGNWSITAPVRIPSGVWLDLSQGARLTLADGVNADVLTNADWAGGNTDITITGGFLDGNRTGQVGSVGDGPGQSLVSMVNVARFRISGVEGTSPFLHGVDCNVRDIAANSHGDPGSTDGIIENCRFTDFGDDGITTHWSSGISIIGCENYAGAGTYSGSTNGFEIDDGSSDVTVVGCVSHHNKDGFVVQGHAGRVPGRRATFSGCVSHDNVRAAFHFSQPTSAGSDPARGVALNGCSSRGDYYGLRVSGYRNVYVSGFNASDVTQGIYITDDSGTTVDHIRVRGGMIEATSKPVLLGSGVSVDVLRVDDVAGVTGYESTAAGDEGGGAAALVAMKTALTKRADTNTLADDPHLSVTVEAGATYLVEGMIVYDSATNADLQLGWTVPAGSAMTWCADGLDSSATSTGAGSAFMLATTAPAGPLRLGGGGLNNPKIAVKPTGTLVAAAAGPVTLQWAQSAANAEGTTVHARSWIRLTKL